MKSSEERAKKFASMMERCLSGLPEEERTRIATKAKAFFKEMSACMPKGSKAAGEEGTEQGCCIPKGWANLMKGCCTQAPTEKTQP
jgi:hypothetical protein